MGLHSGFARFGGMFVLAVFRPDELLTLRPNWQTTPAKSPVIRWNDGLLVVRAE
jgi:hypothetical protein